MEPCTGAYAPTGEGLSSYSHRPALSRDHKRVPTFATSGLGFCVLCARAAAIIIPSQEKEQPRDLKERRQFARDTHKNQSFLSGGLTGNMYLFHCSCH